MLSSALCAHIAPALLFTFTDSRAVFLQALHFSYVVLDEGHVIKNPKSKV